MKILLLSDEEDPALWDYYTPGRLDGYDLIISAGDLDAAYLSFLVTMCRVPVLYVHGNHDGGYQKRPPEGCDCIDDRLVTVNGLRILGLGGSAVYSGGPFQYTERQMRRRIVRAGAQIRRAKGVDLIVTHASPKGFGDDTDYAHRGFEAFLPLIEQRRPKALVHGHVHLRYGMERVRYCGGTAIVNATRRCELLIGEDAPSGAWRISLP